MEEARLGYWRVNIDDGENVPMVISSTSTSKPAQPEQTEQDDGMALSILTVAGALLTTLAVAAFM